MARIDVLPSIEIIRGFKGILDFYTWRGLPCVRAWPRYRPAKQTDASLAAALTFGAIVKSYSLLANLALLAYRQDALDQPRTARDIMVTGVFGNLHEATMSDFLDALIIIRDAVVSLTDLLHALDSIDTDEIIVNVDQSVLPPLAATTTNQATAIASLAKIDDLQDALESKALDRLLVRGMDQHFSLLAPINQVLVEDTHGGGTQSIATPAPDAGEYWIVTALAANNDSGASSLIRLFTMTGGTVHLLNAKVGPAKWVPCTYSGYTVLGENDHLRAYFYGTAPNDVLIFAYHAFRMTVET